MKWRKLGKIFDPTQYSLPNNCVEFAQSPQPVEFDDFVRVYFSTRERDSTGKYLSHIAFVDFDKNFRNIRQVSSKPVIELGGLGCFDEHGIFPMNVLKTGDKIYAYTTGWNRKISVSADASIGFASSDDGGQTFKKLGTGPILSAALHEPFLVGDAYVTVFNKVFYMWYIHGTKWANYAGEEIPERVYKIAYATSSDGISWKRERSGIVTDKLNEDECQALPTVAEYRNLYHMFFCYRHATGFRKNKNRGYRIGYAFSNDLKNWIRDDSRGGIDVSESGWDSDMLCYPYVFKCNERLYLLYNGNEFGRFGFGIAILED